MSPVEGWEYLNAISTSVLEVEDISSRTEVPCFPQFSSLPAELRLAIWENALPGAAVVPRVWNNDEQRFTLFRRTPAVLQACRESRHGLTRNKPTHDRPGVKYQLTSALDGAYINWTRDSIWISRGCQLLHDH